ncbi:UNVERIFIED_CONTAM: protein-S-isoprenylcysteine O-methyltransferase Ste14 [Acetivibrio alkalicellulosi]
MKYISLSLIVLFYIFFFLRAIILSRKIGKSIKAKDVVLNIAIISASISSVIFILKKTLPNSEVYTLTIGDSIGFEIVGTILIGIGLLFSTIASLNLGRSWRVGVNNSEKTELITKGIYKFSRNPYFLFYDIVLIGLSLSSQSILVIVFSLTTISMFHILILKEEKYLENVHGGEYIKYKKQTRRYF